MRAGSPCLHEIFEQRVSEGPDHPAVSFEGKTLTYDALNRRANQIAHFLRGHSVGRETLVGLCLDRSLDTVTAILAVLKAGAAYVPMDPSNPAERVRMIVEDARCPVVIIHETQRVRFSESDTLIVLDGAEQPWEAYPEANPEPLAMCEDLAYVIYTSGSTGRPKGVPIAHRNVTRLFTSISHWFDFRPNDTWPLFHSFAFDLSVWEMWGALLHGGRIVVVPYWVSRTPSDFYRLLVEEKVTQLCQTPSALRQLQAYEDTLEREDWNQLALRYVVLGGEALSFPSLATWFERHGDDQPQIINMYGITETTIHVTYRRVRKHEAVPGTPSYIGVPIPDQPCHVVTGEGLLAEIGDEGELYVGGAGNAIGYMNRPELTAERFVPSPFPEDNGAILYRSGDLVRRLEGDMVYLGRMDRQVQLRGFRVELGEIESTLVTFDGVQGAAVRPHAAGEGDLRLVAYYVSRSALSLTALREHMARSLPEYMVPSVFIRIDAIPLTGNGKTDYRALPEPVVERDDTPYVAPRNGPEEILSTIWGKLLNLPTVGIDDNFFALGGHSLLATRAVMRIQECMGISTSLRAIYENPTIAELAAALSSTSGIAIPTPANEPAHVDRSVPLLLSYAQKQMWILTKIEPELCAYNIPIRIDIQGEVKIDSLNRALSMLVQRHEVLRTVFSGTTDMPQARILPDIDFKLSFHHIDGATPAEHYSVMAREILALAKLPMDLGAGPLLRGALYEFSSDHYGLALIIHHAVFDGWSISVLLRELSDAYHAVVAGRSWNAAPLAFQYVDYAGWQHTYTESPTYKEDINYWKKQLKGPLPVLKMPLDFERPHIQKWQGERIRHLIDPDLPGKVSAVAMQLGVTPFVVILAGWKALLFRYTGQEDSIVGTAMAGRILQAWEPLIGFFVNTVAIRSRITRDLPFARLVERVQEATLAAQEHQEAPFERVVAEVQHHRDPAYSPIFQTMVVLHNTPTYRAEGPDLILTAEELDNGCAKFELTLAIQPVENSLNFDLEFNTALFKRETAAQLLVRLEALLSDAMSNPTSAIGHLRLKPAAISTCAENRPIPVATCAPPSGTCLHQIFQCEVERVPDAVALTCDGTSLSYRELNAQSNRLAHYLQSQGVGSDILVGLCLDRSIDIVVSILAVLKAGGAYVPMDPIYPAERVRTIIEDAQCPVVIAHAVHAARLQTGKTKLIVLDGVDTPWESFPDTNPLSATKDTGLAYVIYTSGSTGKPKGALITHWNVYRLVKEMDPWFNFRADEVWTLFHSYAFDFSVWEMWGAFFHGGRVVVVPHLVSRSPEDFYQLLLDEKVTVLNQTPSAFKQLQRYDESVPIELARQLALRYVIFGGETLDLPGLAGWFDRHGDEKPRLINMYGITETTVFVTYRPVSTADTKAGTPNFIGIGIPDLTLHVLDENRQPVSEGDVGELYVGGDGVGLGYLRRPELSAERFIPDPLNPHSDVRNFYKTGDLVRLWDGDLEFLGRNDMQVQLRGFRVELGEIEATLNTHGAVEGSVVRMREDVPGDQRLVAYYLAKTSLVVEDLREHLLKTLPAYMVPSNFIQLDAFPLNNNGKIDVAALPAPMADATTHDTQEEFESDTERKIAEIWRELLRTDNVRRHDNFFASGGHSLLAIQLLSHINEFFGSTLTLADFFEDPTITGVLGSLFPSQGIKQVQPGCHLRRIREGKRTPIFCLSGAGDLAGTYEYFAEALSEDQPIYGFANLESVDDASVTIEQLADRCITELRKVQPKGPYYLSGFSLGGVIAFEIARKLIEEGEKVPVLAMIDSSTPDHGFTRPSWSLQYLRGLFERAQARIRFFTRTWKLQLGYLRDGAALLVTNMNPLTRADRIPLGLWDFLRWSWTDSSIQYYYIQGGLINPPIGERRLKLYLDQLVRSSTKSVVSSWKILREYKMVPIPVKVTLLRAQHNPYKSERRDPSFGWSLYALNGVQIIELPGNHMVLIRNPYAFALGRAIQQAIDEVEASQSQD